MLGLLHFLKTKKAKQAQANGPLIKLIDEVFEHHELQRKDVRRVVLNFESYE
jgi:fumarylacetoacetate (FAA) hydrolase family protein